MVYNYELTHREKSWINRMLCAPILYKQEIIEQINHAKIRREYTKYYIVLKFELLNEFKRIPVKSGVPIEMRVIRNKGVPIQFLLHVKNGEASGVEIFAQILLKLMQRISIVYLVRLK